jgi:CheY-like chemotaxis protein
MEMPRLILIIEDEKDIRDSLTEAIEGEGYSVAVAGNGLEALSLFVRDQRLYEKMPDLILLDLLMPQMDGATFLERRRKIPTLADVPVVLMSADRRMTQNALLYGAAGHLHKPLELDDLYAKIENFCGTQLRTESKPYVERSTSTHFHDGHPSRR